MSPPSPEKQVPKMGPEPTLLSRKEFDVLYETLSDIQIALKRLGVDAIVTGGSLLGAIRQHSILFCDDDIDLAIIDDDGMVYEERVKPHLQEALGSKYFYQIRPWEGGDRIRPKRMSNIFVDLFVLRKYTSWKDFLNVIGTKKNGQPQSHDYVKNIVSKIIESTGGNLLGDMGQNIEALCPFWQFSTRKAIEMWSKEVYRQNELFPLTRDLKMGPVTELCGPRMPVKILKRAFGQDCFDVYYQSTSHQSVKNTLKSHVEKSKDNDSLPPLLSLGGTWESGAKVDLEDHHYLPVQPISRSARRPTLHNKDRLMAYLEVQIAMEKAWSKLDRSTALEKKRPKTIYMDGVFDLFHIGHLEAIRCCRDLGDRVIIGVTGDADATDYKRKPIVPEKERSSIVQNLKGVDLVICPCPLIVTENFMNKHNIDLVVHGFANERDAERQQEFFNVPIRLGKFQQIPYYNGMSTTDRIEKIQAPKEKLIKEIDATNHKQNWFGATVARVTDSSASISFDPFPIELRRAIEPHIEKARLHRNEALRAIKIASGNREYDTILAQFKSRIKQETHFMFDIKRYRIRESLLGALGVSQDFDLSMLHTDSGKKESLFRCLTKNYSEFQKTYDDFIRNICIPQLVSQFPCEEVYFQAFPCIRIVQPDEFSIGPHADSAYGHHPCSVNFYLPLTKIGGAASLFLESRHGAEDWHPIEGSYGFVKQFSGATNIHWTTENKTNNTRVSLDFRLIPGPLFHVLKCGGGVDGGKKDVYRNTDGYYASYRRVSSDAGPTWEKNDTLPAPDARVGFPWTVKDWNKLRKKIKK